MSNGFDLSRASEVSEKQDEGAWMDVRDENGDLYDGVRIKLAGSYSERYRRAQEQQTTRALKRRTKTVTGELVDRQALAILGSVTLAWEGIKNAGNDIPCTPENAESLYKKAPWIRAQANEFVNDHENFSEGSSST